MVIKLIKKLLLENYNKRIKVKPRNLYSNRGSEIITTPIIMALGMILIAILIVFSIKILTPYIWYEKLSSTCLKYVFIMEEYGYLTNKEKKNLTNELIAQGFEKEELNIYCTSKKQSYGMPIYLNIDYTYKLEIPLLGEREIQMNINRESVSKR